MSDLYGSDISADELRDEVGLERIALIEEFQADAKDAYNDKEQELGSDLMRELERFVTMQVVDTRWREHLENMDYLREGVHLRAFAQKDPLVEYAAEGHRMFEELTAAIREEVVGTLFHAQLAPQEAPPVLEQQPTPIDGNVSYEFERTAGADSILQAGTAAGIGGSVATGGAIAAPAATNGGSGSAQTKVLADNQRVGRNDPCWCGSGKKYKKCHGA